MSRCYGAAIRNEDWFKLIDTSNSGEITVRKLIDHKEFRRMPALFSTLQWKLLEFCEPLRLEHFVIIH